ncbi:MAG: ATP-binding protein [Clostridia bacterium]|jgi:predicted AAA+ superfamily ATPase|nr:ATP-binding protein [Clostridia bacterium]
MIRRTAYDAAIRLAGQFPVVAITGPRQSGKTTLAKAVFPQKQYISLDDKNLRELAGSNPGDFLNAFPNGVIIDEAQKVPELFDAIKLAVDSNKYEPGKYILTGSSQFRLKANISDSLAGRIGMIKLLPFSIEELDRAGQLSPDVYDLVFNGSYPPLYDKEKHFIRDDWFENYIDTYLDLDVKDQINPSNVSAFRKLIQLCAARSGQLINYEDLSRSIGVSAVTIKSWLSILEASFIIHFLEPDSNNLGKSVVKTPKLYFVDSGLMCYLLRLDSKEELLLDEHKGAAVETMAVSELLKKRFNEGKKSNLTFYRDKNGFEVDAIADWKHTFAIEVKSNSSTEKKLSSNVKKYMELRPERTIGRVFYTGDLTCTVNGIQYVSWKDWGK